MRIAAALIAASWFLLVAYIFSQRLLFPFDLEWMEGGVLCHSLRLLEGQPIYGPPSVDFIPFLYTPLYPALLAALAKVVGLGYTMARSISIAAFAAATYAGYRFAACAGGSRLAAAIAMALPAAAFVRTGTFYDLARPDSLWLALVTLGVITLYRSARDFNGQRRNDRNRHALAVGAGLWLVAAFFTKQTASPFLVASTLALAVLDWRLLPTFLASLAITGLPMLWLLNHTTDGWFWTYIFRLHQSHDFYTHRALIETPLHLAALLGPALILVVVALIRRPTAALGYTACLAVLGVAIACIGFGTHWAYPNAYIPGIFFPAIAIGAAAGPLLTSRTWQSGVYLMLALSLLLRLPDYFGLIPHQPLVLAHREEDVPSIVRPIVPSAADRETGEQLIDRLRQVPGEVLIPFHPFYAHLAGKRTYLHRMGVLDIRQAALGPPVGLVEAIRNHRWDLAVFDDKIAGTWGDWPHFLEEYKIDVSLVGPSVVSGAATHPNVALVPKGRGDREP